MQIKDILTHGWWPGGTMYASRNPLICAARMQDEDYTLYSLSFNFKRMYEYILLNFYVE